MGRGPGFFKRPPKHEPTLNTVGIKAAGKLIGKGRGGGQERGAHSEEGRTGQPEENGIRLEENGKRR